MEAVTDEWTNASQGKTKHSKILTATLSILHRMTLIELKTPRVVTLGGVMFRLRWRDVQIKGNDNVQMVQIFFWI
jgi:hypothetical protein